MKTLQNTSWAALIVATSLLAPRLVFAGDILSDTPPPAPRVEHEPPQSDLARSGGFTRRRCAGGQGEGDGHWAESVRWPVSAMNTSSSRYACRTW